MTEVKLQSAVKARVFLLIIVILVGLCAWLYILKEKENSLRVFTERELSRTIEAKEIVEGNLAQARKEIASRDEQIKFAFDKLEQETGARKDAQDKLLTAMGEKNALEEKIKEIEARSANVDLETIVVKPAAN